MPAIANNRGDILKKYEDELERTGKVQLTQDELVRLFDALAQKFVGMSGEEAFQKIRSGNAGQDEKWASLVLLASLFK